MVMAGILLSNEIAFRPWKYQRRYQRPIPRHFQAYKTLNGYNTNNSATHMNMNIYIHEAQGHEV